MRMRNSESYRMRNTVLVALFLLGGGIFANIYLTGNESREQGHVIAGAGFYGNSAWLLENPGSSFFPAWSLKRKAISISPQRNASVLKSVLEVFNPSLKSFLTLVPIVLDSSADTAKAYPAKGYIGVSPDWDNTVRQSQYRTIYEQRGMKTEDPVFTPHFKTDLLIHEFLHILQVHLNLDRQACYEAVARWYLDPRYGLPSATGIIDVDTMKAGIPDALAINRMKYIVWHELYNYRKLSEVPQDGSWKKMQYGARYRLAKKGVEEFAYIGQEILSSGSSSENYLKTGQWCEKDWQNKKLRLLEVSPEIVTIFKGVFNPELMQMF